MKVSVKAIAFLSCFAAISMPAAAGNLEDQAAAQFKSFNSMFLMDSVNIPVSKPAPGLTRDIFREVDACSVLNAQFVMQPVMKDALNMLKPCLAGVSKMAGNAIITASEANNGKAIEIVVLGSKNEDVKELVRGALAKRNNEVFGYPATAVLRTAMPLAAAAPSFVYADVFSQVPACSVVDAQFLMQPLMKDAMNMLTTCLDGVSKFTGAPVSAASVKNGKAIEIVILGGKNANVLPLMNSTIAKRHGQLFGYPATAVLNAAAPL